MRASARLLARIKGKADVAAVASLFINFEVLKAFKRATGHLDVPQGYVVGQNDSHKFPSVYEGFALGAYTRYLQASMRKNIIDPAQATKLLDLGLSASRPKNHFVWKSVDFELLYTSLLAYKEYNRSTAVPWMFVIPKGNEVYPAGSAGMPLGFVLDLTLSNPKHADSQKLLLELGMHVDRTGHEGFERVYSALLTYKAIYGDVHVPRRFIVPGDDPRFPESMWWLSLGPNVSRIRAGTAYADFSPLLEELGMDYSQTRRSVVQWRFELVWAILRAHKRLHGNLDIPATFKVPKTSDYPTVAWGWSFGYVLRDIRSQKIFLGQREKLEKLGVRYMRDKNITAENVIAALRAFKSEHGHAEVPVPFIVPRGDAAYPLETVGLRLGWHVLDIRRNGLFAERRAELRALGVRGFQEPVKLAAIDPSFLAGQRARQKRQQRRRLGERLSLSYSAHRSFSRSRGRQIM